MMTMNKRTKRMFAQAVQELMKTRTLSEVRVKDICEICETNRHTFYYHFQDKYDLVGWIFAEDSMSAMQNKSDMTIEEKIEVGIGLIEEKRMFYKKAFEDHSQNSLEHLMQNYNVELSLEVLRRYYETKDIPAEMILTVQYHSHGCIGLTIDWLNGRLKLSKKEFAKFQATRMPLELRDAFQGLVKSKS